METKLTDADLVAIEATLPEKPGPLPPGAIKRPNGSIEVPVVLADAAEFGEVYYGPHDYNGQ